MTRTDTNICHTILRTVWTQQGGNPWANWWDILRPSPKGGSPLRWWIRPPEGSRGRSVALHFPLQPIDLHTVWTSWNKSNGEQFDPEEDVTYVARQEWTEHSILCWIKNRIWNWIFNLFYALTFLWIYKCQNISYLFASKKKKKKKQLKNLNQCLLPHQRSNTYVSALVNKIIFVEFLFFYFLILILFDHILTLFYLNLSGIAS